jgi:hypothetical protein
MLLATVKQLPVVTLVVHSLHVENQHDTSTVDRLLCGTPLAKSGYSVTQMALEQR